MLTQTCGGISEILDSVDHIESHVASSSGVKDVFDGCATDGHVSVADRLHLK